MVVKMHWLAWNVRAKSKAPQWLVARMRGSCDRKETDSSFFAAAPILVYIACMSGIKPYAGGGGDNARRAKREHDVVAGGPNAALPEGRETAVGQP